MPWGAIEAIARLIYLILEGIPAAQRRATAIAWFWLWWPLGKLVIRDKAAREQIESIMREVGKDGGQSTDQQTPRAGGSGSDGYPASGRTDPAVLTL